MAKAKSRKRPGLPDPKTVVAELQIVPASRGPLAVAPGSAPASYRIIRTNQVDPYDAPMPKSAVAAIAAPAAPPSDTFGGTDRRAAKLAIASGKADAFADLKKLLDDLPSEASMKKHQPPITKDANSGRVAEEKRNVRVQAFLYAASREGDNDFHMIIGRDPGKSPLYMTAELSGLPPKSSASFARLKKARDAYKTFLSGNLPGLSYDFYDPPIPIEVEGSLFFDVTHATGSRPGPKSLKSKMPTIWEIHPISKIVFEP
jgi:hypothetical protein